MDEQYLEYDKFYTDEYEYSEKEWYSSYQTAEYIKVGKKIYCPVYFIKEISNGFVHEDGNDIYVYSYEYYKKNHCLYHNIGKKLNVKSYVNDIEIDASVYYNIYSDRDNSLLSSFVELRPVLEAAGAKVTFVPPNRVEVKYQDRNTELLIGSVMYCSTEKKYDYGDSECIAVDGKTYVSFSSIRTIIGGSLSETDNAIRLYTEDFERTDIPATLEEAYKYFDENLSYEDIEKIKNASSDELPEFHFGLGQWVRNKWIRPTTGRIAKLFLDRGINVPDDISSYIIEGYSLYLKGEACGIDDIIKP